MVTTKFKWTSGWVTLLPDRVLVRVDDKWVGARSISIRDNGVWRDIGYYSAPPVPTAFHIYYWDYDNVDLRWTAPDGGTSPDSYEIRRTDVNDANPYTLFLAASKIPLKIIMPVSKDTKYQFKIRSVTNAGLKSPWSAPIKAGIGHPQVISQRWAQRNTPWQSQNPGEQLGLYNGLIVGPTAPALSYTYGFETGVYVTGMHMELWSPYFTDTSGPILRQTMWLANGTADINGDPQELDIGLPWGPGWVANGSVGNGLGTWSDGRSWGVYLTGSGYDDKYGGYKPMYERIIIAGTYYYAVKEDYVTTTEKSNYYW